MSMQADRETPRLERRAPLLIAGLCERYRFDATSAIPGQWQRFTTAVDDVPERTGAAAYGIMLPVAGFAEGFDYLTGVEVTRLEHLPDSFSHAQIPAARYAVFEHHGHVSGIKAAWQAVWSRWLPQAGLEVADEPIAFEQYGADFDPEKGQGVVSLWVPLR